MSSTVTTTLASFCAAVDAAAPPRQAVRVSIPVPPSAHGDAWTLPVSGVPSGARAGALTELAEEAKAAAAAAGPASPAAVRAALALAAGASAAWPRVAAAARLYAAVVGACVGAGDAHGAVAALAAAAADLGDTQHITTAHIAAMEAEVAAAVLAAGPGGVCGDDRVLLAAVGAMTSAWGGEAGAAEAALAAARAAAAGADIGALASGAVHAAAAHVACSFGRDDVGFEAASAGARALSASGLACTPWHTMCVMLQCRAGQTLRRDREVLALAHAAHAAAAAAGGGGDAPDAIGWLSPICVMSLATGDFAECEARCAELEERSARVLGVDSVMLMNALLHRGALATAAWRLNAAVGAAAVAEALVDAFPCAAGDAPLVAFAGPRVTLAEAYGMSGRGVEALSLVASVVARCDAATPSGGFAPRLFDAYAAAAVLAAETDDVPRAEAWAGALLARTRGAAPGSLLLVHALVVAADIAVKQGRASEAASDLKAALAIVRAMVPGEALPALAAGPLCRLATVYVGMPDCAEAAMSCATNATVAARELSASDRAQAENVLASCWFGRGNTRESLAHIDAAVALVREATGALGGAHASLANLLQSRAELLASQGDDAAALAAARESAAVYRSIAARGGEDARGLAAHLVVVAASLARCGSGGRAAAAAFALEGLAALRAHVPRGDPGHLRTLGSLAELLGSLDPPRGLEVATDAAALAAELHGPRSIAAASAACTRALAAWYTVQADGDAAPDGLWGATLGARRADARALAEAALALFGGPVAPPGASDEATAALGGRVQCLEVVANSAAAAGDHAASVAAQASAVEGRVAIHGAASVIALEARLALARAHARGEDWARAAEEAEAVAAAAIAALGATHPVRVAAAQLWGDAAVRGDDPASLRRAARAILGAPAADVHAALESVPVLLATLGAPPPTDGDDDAQQQEEQQQGQQGPGRAPPLVDSAAGARAGAAFIAHGVVARLTADDVLPRLAELNGDGWVDGVIGALQCVAGGALAATALERALAASVQSAAAAVQAAQQGEGGASGDDGARDGDLSRSIQIAVDLIDAHRSVAEAMASAPAAVGFMAEWEARRETAREGVCALYAPLTEPELAAALSAAMGCGAREVRAAVDAYNAAYTAMLVSGGPVPELPLLLRVVDLYAARTAVPWRAAVAVARATGARGEALVIATLLEAAVGCAAVRLNVLRELGLSERAFDIASLAHDGPELRAALRRLKVPPSPPLPLARARRHFFFVWGGWGRFRLCLTARAQELEVQRAEELIVAPPPAPFAGGAAQPQE